MDKRWEDLQGEEIDIAHLHLRRMTDKGLQHHLSLLHLLKVLEPGRLVWKEEMGYLIDTCPILNRLLSNPEKYVMNIRIPHGRRKLSIHDIYQGIRTAWGNINVTPK